MGERANCTDRDHPQKDDDDDVAHIRSETRFPLFLVVEVAPNTSFRKLFEKGTKRIKTVQ